uniref:Mast cell-expressed membrane protein 1 n=1 Tax=Sciurus vulgaris TaxID=55149 RepID=A0A8D2DX97_SCIVU
MQTAAFQGKKGGNADGDKVPAQPRPSSDPVQVPTWVHRAIMSLYILLALTFLFLIILSILILLKNSEMSRELLSLKRELWNASSAAQECREEQKKGWTVILQNFTKVQGGHEKLKTVPAEVNQINKNTQKILELLGRNTSTATPE